MSGGVEGEQAHDHDDQERLTHLQKHAGGRPRILVELNSHARTLVLRSEPRHAMGDHTAASAASQSQCECVLARERLSAATWLLRCNHRVLA